MAMVKIGAGWVILFLGWSTACQQRTDQASSSGTAQTTPTVNTPPVAGTPAAVYGDSSTIGSQTANPAGSAVQPASLPPIVNAPVAPQYPSSSGESLSSGGGLRSEVSSLGGNVSDMESAMHDLNAQVVGDEIAIELSSDVLFNFNKHAIRPDAATTLEKVLTIVEGQARRGSVRIEGHTDAIAEMDYNQRLSERRANAVKNWLMERGVADARLRTSGYGELRPRDSNTKPDGSDNPRGRQRNRRVEIFVAKG